MKRVHLVSTVLLLSLAAAGPGRALAAADDDQRSEEREKKQERRVLRASDFDRQTLSEAYRLKAREKRHESMRFLKDILSNRAPQGTQKAEMMLRLAELYFEEGRDVYLSEMEEYQKEYDRCFNTPGCDPESMKPDNSESTKWKEKAIRLYRAILDSYPQYQRADEATFFLGSALWELDRKDEALREFTRLVRTYPDSDFVPDAYVLIGEYYFDHNNAYKALLAYKKAARYKTSDKYPFAMYKLAWCYYNVGEYGKAIDTMKAVVSYSMTPQEGQSDKKRLTLQDEALKDLVRFFADAGEMDEAYAYFNKLGKKDLIRAMLKRLASTYFEQGKFEQCIQTYRRLIAEDPQSADAPEYQNEIVKAYRKIGRKKETMAEIQRMLETYGKDSAWARANSANQSAIKKAQEYIEQNLRTVAVEYHNEAKKLGTGRAAKEAYALAYKAYKVYLQQFPEGKHAYDMHYAFAELLYKIKKYDEAYEHYMKVVDIDPKGQHSRFCAKSAIFAAEQMIKRTGEGKERGASKTEPVPLGEWEKKLVEACDLYARLYPDDKELTKKAIYKAAYLFYDHNMFKEASDRFRTVIAMDPKSREAEQAANLILDSFALVKDWQNLKEVAKAFYDQEGLGSQKFKRDVYGIYRRASLKLIEVNFEKTKDELAAAKAYMDFYREFPDSDVADLALNNAAVYFYNQGRLKESMEARLELASKFPKSKYYKDTVAALGFAYETITDFAEAAKWYEKLFALDKAHPGAKDAIYSAAVFRRALGEWQSALADYQKFITAYPDDPRVPAVTITVAELYEEHGKIAEASKVHYSFFTKPPPNATIEQVFYARLQYGLLLDKLGQVSKAKRHFAETLKAWEKVAADAGPSNPAIEFIARIMFMRAQEQLDRYMAMRIDGPKQKTTRWSTDRILKKQLQDKVKALVEVEKTYAEIIKTGAGEWGLAALIQLGKAYENMAETLRTSYVPHYLTEDQAEIYRMGLEDKAYVQEEKAVNAYVQALQKAYELKLYNENTAYAVRRLAELRPDDYPPLEEELLEPRYTARAKVELPLEEQP